MRVGVYLVGLTAAVVPFGVPAEAAPLSQARVARVAFAVGDPGGAHHRVQLTARDGTSRRLSLQVQSCTDARCESGERYEARLSSAAVRIDPSAAVADLRITLSGRPLVIRWQPDDQPGVQGGTEGAGDERGHWFAFYRTQPALARITLGRETCTAPGGVGDEARFEEPAGAPFGMRHVSALKLGRGLTCTS